MSTTSPVRTALFVLLLAVFGLVAGLGGYYAGGRSDAIDDALPLARLADRLIRHGEGGEGLGASREQAVLQVAGPKLTRSLARRLAFDPFVPGVSKIRLEGYASGLEKELSRPRLIALWLETVEMGKGPNGWMKGFYEASKDIYDRPPSQLSDAEFKHLLAIARSPLRLRVRPTDWH